MDSEQKDYVPLGDEWRKEMMKLSKPQLVDFVKNILQVPEDTQRDLWGDVADVINGDSDNFTHSSTINKLVKEYIINRR